MSKEINNINHELIIVEAICASDKYKPHPHNSSRFNKHVTYAFDGFKLNNLTITLSINTSTEANYIIANLAELKHMLEIHKRCLPPYEWEKDQIK